jgi:hypothetical protein
VPVWLRFQLTDTAYRPIAGEPVRLHWGEARSAELLTDSEGRAEMRAQGHVERRRVKRPTNFVSQLLSLPQPVDCAVAGAELDYAGHRWLYTAELFRFAGGDVMLGERAVCTPDSEGRHTHKARKDGMDWRMADWNGLLLTNAGHEPWQFQLQPEGEGWVMDLAFKRYPTPVRR